MSYLNPAKLRAWIASRPKAVRELAERFPIGMPMDETDPKTGKTLYVVGWQESGSIVVSSFNPLDVEQDDYDAMMAERQYVCAKCALGIEHDHGS